MFYHSKKKYSTYVVQSRKYFVGATKERWQMIWQKIHRILSAQKGKFDILLHLGLLPIGQTFAHIVSAMLRPWWHFNYIEALKWKKMTGCQIVFVPSCFWLFLFMILATMRKQKQITKLLRLNTLGNSIFKFLDLGTNRISEKLDPSNATFKA